MLKYRTVKEIVDHPGLRIGWSTAHCRKGRTRYYWGTVRVFSRLTFAIQWSSETQAA